MRVQRILGVTVASIALAVTGIAGATGAQADDGFHHKRHHHGRHHYHKRHHRRRHHHEKRRHETLDEHGIFA